MLTLGLLAVACKVATVCVGRVGICEGAQGQDRKVGKDERGRLGEAMPKSLLFVPLPRIRRAGVPDVTEHKQQDDPTRRVERTLHDETSYAGQRHRPADVGQRTSATRGRGGRHRLSVY